MRDQKVFGSLLLFLHNMLHFSLEMQLLNNLMRQPPLLSPWIRKPLNAFHLRFRAGLKSVPLKENLSESQFVLNFHFSPFHLEQCVTILIAAMMEKKEELDCDGCFSGVILGCDDHLPVLPAAATVKMFQKDVVLTRRITKKSTCSC